MKEGWCFKMKKTTELPFSPVWFFFGAMLLAFLIHMQGWEEGYRAGWQSFTAHQTECPPHIKAVLEQK